ncbi:hypothetical protein ACFX15_001192 [Malus domestica]
MPVPFGEHPNIAFETAYISYKHGRTWEPDHAFLLNLQRHEASVLIPDPSSTLMEFRSTLHPFGFMPQIKEWQMQRSAIRKSTYHGHSTSKRTSDKEIISSLFVDFVTNVSVDENRIFVQVGPPMLRDLPSNANLNGLEIMKMSTRRDSLDGTFQRITMQI